MAEFRLRELYPTFDEELDYLVDMMLDQEIDADELRRQATSAGISEHNIQRAIAFASETEIGSCVPQTDREG